MATKKRITKAAAKKKVSTKKAVEALEDNEPKPITNAMAQRLMALGLLDRVEYEAGIDAGTIKPARGGGLLSDDEKRRAITKLWKVVANWNASTGSELGMIGVLRIQFQNGTGADGEPKTKSIKVDDKKLGVQA